MVIKRGLDPDVVPRKIKESGAYCLASSKFKWKCILGFRLCEILSGLEIIGLVIGKSERFSDQTEKWQTD